MKRYDELQMVSNMEPSEDGEWVRYEDYAKDREALCNWMHTRGIPTGHGDTVRDLIPWIDEKILDHRRDIQRLREALETIAERDCRYGDNCPPFGSSHGTCDPCTARKALEGGEGDAASVQREDMDP